MKSIIRYTILTAFRDWLFLGIFLLVLFSIGLSVFLGHTALIEESMMSTTYIAGITRMIVVVGLTLFVCFHVRRSFDNKEVEFILTRPISRTKFVVSYFVGFMLLAFFIIFPITIILYGLSFTKFISINLEGLLLWSICFYMESAVMVAFAFFASLLLSSAVLSAMLCFAFYFLARIFGFLLISINNPTSLSKSSKITGYMEEILNIISIIIPRLDMINKSEWLIYGVSNTPHINLFLSSIIMYIPFILTMAILDFSRKQF